MRGEQYLRERREAWLAAGGSGRYVDDVSDDEIVQAVGAVTYSARDRWAPAADVARCLELDVDGCVVGGRLRRLARAGRLEYNRGHGPHGWRVKTNPAQDVRGD